MVSHWENFNKWQVFHIYVSFRRVHMKFHSNCDLLWMFLYVLINPITIILIIPLPSGKPIQLQKITMTFSQANHHHFPQQTLTQCTTMRRYFQLQQCSFSCKIVHRYVNSLCHVNGLVCWGKSSPETFPIFPLNIWGSILFQFSPTNQSIDTYIQYIYNIILV